MKLTLNPDALAVQSFDVAGDPTQWTAAASPVPTEPETVAFDACIAHWGKPVTVDTGDRCCE